MDELTARLGDVVQVEWLDQHALTGTVTQTPRGDGDSWAVVATDGTIYHFNRFDLLTVLSRSGQAELGDRL